MAGAVERRHLTGRVSGAGHRSGWITVRESLAVTAKGRLDGQTSGFRGAGGRRIASPLSWRRLATPRGRVAHGLVGMRLKPARKQASRLRVEHGGWRGDGSAPLDPWTFAPVSAAEGGAVSEVSSQSARYGCPGRRPHRQRTPARTGRLVPPGRAVARRPFSDGDGSDTVQCLVEQGFLATGLGAV